jgi:hypothetical protein
MTDLKDRAMAFELNPMQQILNSDVVRNGDGRLDNRALALALWLTDPIGGQTRRALPYRA